MGPGNASGMTLAAHSAIEESDVIYGYTAYISLIGKLFPEKECRSTGMRQERERVMQALGSAQTRTTTLVCSGDAVLYGMAGLAYELSADYPGAEITVVPGVSAAFSGSAVLGAPLTHDFAAISLSDLLTPWEKIEKRLLCAAQADLTIVLYNPASKHRPDHLRRACDIVLTAQPSETVCGYVRNIGRDGEVSGILTLAELRDFEADMFTTVFIGNSETRIIGGKMVTPRGYRNA
jgi:precorrin-3B C17-methyltransferase